MPSGTTTSLPCFLYGPCIAVAVGCGIGVGDPCIPEKVPPDGFAKTETYLETNSGQCESRVCGVFFFEGDPSGQLTDQSEVEDKIYCTCRCQAPNEDFATCECPKGFECQKILGIGGPGVQGSYCVRRGR